MLIEFFLCYQCCFVSFCADTHT